MTEEVPCERSRVSGGNSSNVEEELSRNFQIPRPGAQSRSQGLSSEGRKTLKGDKKTEREGDVTKSRFCLSLTHYGREKFV